MSLEESVVFDNTELKPGFQDELVVEYQTVSAEFLFRTIENVILMLPQRQLREWLLHQDKSLSRRWGNRLQNS